MALALPTRYSAAGSSHALRAGYCMGTGSYRTYSGDGNHSTGATKTQMDNRAALWKTPVESITIGSKPDASLTGYAGHVNVHVPAWSGGGSHHLAATTGVGSGNTYFSQWQPYFDAIIAQGLNTDQCTISFAWEMSGNNSWGGYGDGSGGRATDPNTGSPVTDADIKGMWRNFVLSARAYGISSNVTFEWNIMTGGMTRAALEALWPGDDVVDVIGWDAYLGNPYSYVSGGYARTDIIGIWNNEMLRDLNTVANMARAHSKLAGAGEGGNIQSADTSSNSYKYRPADSYLLLVLLWNYLHDNADVWAFYNWFEQNQSSAGVVNEDTQTTYLGTNAAAQAAQAPNYKNTNDTGIAYWTTSPLQANSLPAFQQYFAGLAGRGAGSMQQIQQFTYRHQLQHYPTAAAAFATAWSGATGPATASWASAPGPASAVVAVRQSNGTTGTLTWAPPTDGTASAVTGYRVSRDGLDRSGSEFADQDVPATARSFDFTNLGTGDYTLTVRTVGTAGSTGETRVDLPALGRPIVVTGVTAIATGSGSAYITWAPSGNNPTSYTVVVSTGSTLTTGDLFQDKFGDTYAGTAVPTGVGHGGSTPVDQFGTLFIDSFGVPPGSVPPPTGGVAVTQVVVGLSAIITGLDPQTTYTVTVTAANDVGVGATSSPKTFVTLPLGTATPPDPGVPPVLELPLPIFAAFPVGGSFRPVNFGKVVAFDG